MRYQSVSEPFFSDMAQTFFRYQCGENLFSVSSLSEFFSPVNSSGFAIKYVTGGLERYIVNRHSYLVGAGEYLLLNGYKETEVEIESKANAKGICINISSELVAEVIASAIRPDAPYTDTELAAFFYTDHFLEYQYRATDTSLGESVNRISGQLMGGHFCAGDIHAELFYELAEKLVTDQVQVFSQLQAIPALKYATKKDLYRRLQRGREYMHHHFTDEVSIGDVANEAAMSAYHFFRLFKKVFQVTPHQYILRKRLALGLQLIRQHCPVSTTALECGFSDIYSFSKAFKGFYGIAPSAVHKKNSSF